MQIIKTVKSDKLYDINFTLQNSAGTAIDLTGATLKLKAQHEHASTLAVDAAMSIVDAATGRCKYNVQAGDFVKVGKYRAEIEVTYGSGQVITFKNFIIDVEPELPAT